MKRIFTISALAVCLSLCLSGCSTAGTIWANYREISQLRLIQTLGVDTAPDGLRLTVSTGSGSGGASGEVISREAQSITLAMASLQDYTPAQQLYYAQSRHIVFGEEYASQGIGRLLDYISSDNDIRLNVAMFVLRGARAQDLMSGGREITEYLSSIQRDSDLHGYTHVFNCGETARRLAESGAALICALGVAETDGSVFPDAQLADIAVPAGFGVLVGDRLAAYIDADDAPAACILTGNAGLTNIELADVTVCINRADVKIKPLWSEGRPSVLEISVEVNAVIAEAPNDDPDMEALAGLLEYELYERTERVLELEKALNADFLGLGASIRADSAQKFDALTEPWLTDAELKLSVSAKVEPVGIPKDTPEP